MRHILKNTSVFKILLFYIFFEFSLWMIFAAISFRFTIANPTGNVSCTQGVSTFTEALLLSVETGVTIGYGTWSVTGNCYGLIICWMVFILSSKINEGMVLGLLFMRFNDWIQSHRCRENISSP